MTWRLGPVDQRTGGGRPPSTGALAVPWPSGKARLLALLSLVAGALLLLGAPVPAASAADSCANAQFRTGAGAHLPDCRAYELVSPADKGANTLLFNRTSGAGTIYPAAGGDAVTFAVLTPLPGAVGALPNQDIASRSASGWSSRSVTPADCAPDPSGIGGPTYHFEGTSRDFSQVFIGDVQSCLNPRDQAGRDVYVVGRDGSYTWLSQNGQIKTDDVDASFVNASADGSHVLFRTAEPLIPAIDGDRLPGLPNQPFTGRGLYDRTGGETYEVGVDGDGKLLNVCGTDLAGPAQSTRSVSSDGRVVFFTPEYRAAEPDCDYAHGGGQLFARVDNARTVELSRSQIDPSAVPTGAATFLGASADGRHVFFSSPDQLVADSAAVDGGLYEYDLSDVLSGASPTGTLTFITPAPPVHPIQPALAVSPDGASAYFATQGVLPAGGEVNRWSVFRFDHGHLRHVVTSASSFAQPGKVSISPDLSKVAYIDVPTGGVGQVYLYDADRPSATPACVSCPPAGVTATAAAQLRSAVGGLRPVSVGRPTFVTNEGHVYFGSPDRISDRDVNDAWDVYEYANGTRTLLSAGTGSKDSLLIGVGGPDGRDVFFATNDSLVGADFDNGDQDIYDARVGGGFPAPPPPKIKCAGDECQPQAPAPTLAAPGSVAFVAPFAAAVHAPAKLQEQAKKVSVKRPKTVRGATKVRLSVKAPEAGRIRVSGSGLKRAKKMAKQAKTYHVTVKLSKRSKRILRRKHRVKVRATVRFTPKHGKRSRVRVHVTFKTKKHRGKAKRRSHDGAHRSAGKGGR